MTLVLDKFRSLLPRTKTSPSGWLSFNAPCCHHRGHGADERKRGGIIFSQGVAFHCFNCKFTAYWEPGRPIGEKFKLLCTWLGANQDDIKQLVFEALKTEAVEYKEEQYTAKPVFVERPLPDGSLPLVEWAKIIQGEPEEQNYVDIIQYLVSRGYDDPFKHNFFWSPNSGYEDRVIIPFYYDGKIVGNTARKTNKGKPKYLSDHPSQFVFNVDEQKEESRYIFVVEGPFDALSIGGVALLTNDIADQQARIIDSFGKEVIVIPDQDKPGLNLIDKAVHYNWAVAFPNWENDVKDCADAVKKYGKLFVVVDILKTAEKNPIKIEMAKRSMIHKLKLE